MDVDGNLKGLFLHADKSGWTQMKTLNPFFLWGEIKGLVCLAHIRSYQRSERF